MPTSAADDELADFLHGMQLRLSRLALVLAGNVQDADDLVQDTMVKVVRKWASVQQSSDPVAYTCRVMINHWRDASRRVGRTRRLEALRHQELDSIDAGPWPHVLDTLSMREALKRLTANQRTVLYFRYYEDLSVRQVADRLGCSVGNVKSQSSHALRALSNTAELSPEQPQ